MGPVVRSDVDSLPGKPLSLHLVAVITSPIQRDRQGLLCGVALGEQALANRLNLFCLAVDGYIDGFRRREINFTVGALADECDRWRLASLAINQHRRDVGIG